MINSHPIGIMQGRLVNPKERGIQFFPFEEWEEEFQIASKAGLDEIDFIFDLERYEENPLWSEKGVDKITREIYAKYGKDFFMRRPFFRVSEKEREENIKILQKLLDSAKVVEAENIEIPLLDNSSVKTEKEKNILIKSLKECLSKARDIGITLSLEADLPPKDFFDLVQRFADPFLKITYDSGNSSSLGYDSYEEVKAYGKYISNVHIKDRVLGGSTVPLGKGDANFEKLFGGLKAIGYKGSFTLQAARQEDGKEVDAVLSCVDFVKNYINKYLS